MCAGTAHNGLNELQPRFADAPCKFRIWNTLDLEDTSPAVLALALLFRLPFENFFVVNTAGANRQV